MDVNIRRGREKLQVEVTVLMGGGLSVRKSRGPPMIEVTVAPGRQKRGPKKRKGS